MPHLLALALGPVQDFIAAARRTRDLWYGSWMLSELARAAGRAIESLHPGSLVFPAASHLGDEDAAFANKLLARVPENPRDVARAAERAARDKLQELRKQTFDKWNGIGGFRRGEADAQVADLIEIQWASAPEGAQGYRGARDEAERLLGARKNARDWSQPTWAAAVRKRSEEHTS